ncbi:MAG: hypothetical protein KDC34_14940 [Saprospiraceae bacterium]|nr:hypothetical protein [Saprospiraceae bacterium]
MYSLRTIFYIQLGLMTLIGILFTIGYFTDVFPIGAFLFTIILGALGASVSLMKRIRDQKVLFETEVKDLKMLAVFIPILYGTLLSGVAYLLFMSGILSGENGGGLIVTNLFPNFIDTSSGGSVLDKFVQVEPEGINDIGKLLVWCFLAGYSESFVTGILGQLESRTAKRD